MIIKGIGRAVLAAAGGLALAAGAVTGAGPAAAAGPAERAQHCVTVLGALDARTGMSAVVSRTCGAGAEAAVPAASTRLIDIFFDANYVRFLDTFYGNFGTCDSAGYHITLPAFDGSNITSISGYGNCDAAVLTNRQGHGEFLWLPEDNIGPGWNDNVSAIRAMRG